MSDNILTCANDGCEETFKPKTHNQKYHSDECCRLATNRRIMKNYYRQRDQKAGKVRYCSVCNITKLSRYNDGQVCAPCETKQQANARNSVLDMLTSAALVS